MSYSKTRLFRVGTFAVAAAFLAFACSEDPPKKKKSTDDDGNGGSSSTTTTTTGAGGAATTTTATTTTVTTTTTTTGGGMIECIDVVGAGCPAPDQLACECAGCNAAAPCEDENGVQDCICPACATDAYCSNAANCQTDGLCDPFYEGCVCPDCADHPMCP